MFTQGYWEWYGFLLRDNCRWLKTFLFNTSRSWYLAYGFLKPLERQRLLEYSEDAYMWSLVYETKRGLMIEFYNILNEIQLRALIEKIRNFTNQYQLFVLLINRAVRESWWYDLYTYLSSRGIPYAVLVDSGSRGILSWKASFEIRKQLFTSILRNKLIITYSHNPLNDPTLSIRVVVFVRGKPVAIGVVSIEICKYISDMVCGEDEIKVLEIATKSLEARRV